MLTCKTQDMHRDTIYEQLFESNAVSRCVEDNEPLILDAMDPSLSITFAELRTKVRSLAIALRESPFYLKEGDVVLFCSKDHIECPIALYGVAAAGCAACMIPSISPVSDIQRIVQSTQPKAVIAHPDTIEKINKVYQDDIPIPVLMIGGGFDTFNNTTNLSQWYTAHAQVESPPCVHPDTCAFLILTSGTTSSPKLVQISQRVMAARIRSAQSIPRSLLFPDNRKPAAFVMSHVAFSSWIMICSNCTCQGVPHYVGDFWRIQPDLDTILSKIQELSITTFFLLDARSMTRIATSNDQLKYDMSSLCAVYTGGQSISQDVLQAAANKLQATIMSAYAATEAGLLFILGYASPSNLAQTYPHDSISAEIKLVNEQGREVPVGKPGELWVKGSMNATGYHGRPDLTAENFDKDGFYHTGDIFIKDENGQYTMLGRYADVIKTADGHFYPKSIEDICMEFQGIKQCVIVGALSTKHGQELPRAYIVPTTNACNSFDQEQIEKLKEYVKARVPLKSMTLNGGIKIVDELPTARSGKVDRYKLRKLAHEELDSENDV
ncbi:acetyl-CoA synthetase-like protein [Lichtheimia hyalospora FSU 10163]|nr:acetyl-CoA synthetase-like protein [Lichtheimia hyalospora FSU 10163]